MRSALLISDRHSSFLWSGFMRRRNFDIRIQIEGGVYFFGQEKRVVLVLVWVCACVCSCDSVRVCACVTVSGRCVRVCVVKSWRPGLRSMCVCVLQCETLAPREYSRTQKRENSHPRTHKIEPTAAARHRHVHTR